MITILKHCLTLFIFMCFLTVEVNGRPIFNHIYKVISPATTYVQDSVEGLFKTSVAGTKEYSKKLFDNSVPRVKDSVESKLSGHARKSAEPLEKVSEEDRKKLNQLIKNH